MPARSPSSNPDIASVPASTWYPFPAPLLQARFLARPNRFIVIAELNGQPVRAHCPSPGRLTELLVPDAELRLHKPPRKGATEYSLLLIKSGRQWVNIDTQVPNRLFQHHLDGGQIPEFGALKAIKREFTWGRSRFDFHLERDGRPPVLAEIKCCNLVDGRMARFPDAVSARASKHLDELGEARHAGYEPWIVFLITRPDADSFSPHRAVDPVFGDALARAHHAGVGVLAITHEVRQRGMRLAGRVPVLL
ncbi:MAG: DNA/RNA nuclease SfsA [bacterium]